jgi:hypothetical protein
MLLLLVGRLMAANVTCDDICQEMNDDDVPAGSSGAGFELANWTCSHGAPYHRTCFDVNCICQEDRNVTRSCQFAYIDSWSVDTSCCCPSAPTDGGLDASKISLMILTSLFGLAIVTGCALILYCCCRHNRAADVQAAIAAPVPGMMVVDRLPGRPGKAQQERDEPLLP